MDLSSTYRTDDVVSALQLDTMSPGALVPLLVTATLMDNTPIAGVDCVRLVPPGSPPGMLSVVSDMHDAWIGVDPLDLTLDGGGFADFDRTYPLTSVITLTAEDTFQSIRFAGWRVDGEMLPTSSLAIDVVISSNQHLVEPVYLWAGDMDGDGIVNLNDFAVFATCFGTANGADGCSVESHVFADLNRDSVIDLRDFAIFAVQFGSAQ
jgi:hypothetical protein